MLKQKTYGKFLLPLVNIFFAGAIYASITQFGQSMAFWGICVLFAVCSFFFGLYYDNIIIRSTKDYLTKSYNRLFATEYLNLLLEQYKREGTPFSIINIDLDNFKYINDTYGHSTGDLVLLYISDILKQSTRKMDSVCRLGGDEFLIICPNTTKDQAMKVKKRIKDTLKKSKKDDREKYKDYHKKPSYYFKGISFGVTEFNANFDSIKSFLDDADKEMYHYKKLHKEIRTKVDEEIQKSLTLFKNDQRS